MRGCGQCVRAAWRNAVLFGKACRMGASGSCWRAKVKESRYASPSSMHSSIHIQARNRPQLWGTTKPAWLMVSIATSLGVEEIEVAQHDQVALDRFLVRCLLRYARKLACMLDQRFAEGRDFGKAPGVHGNTFAVVDVYRCQCQISPTCLKAGHIGRACHLITTVDCHFGMLQIVLKT